MNYEINESTLAILPLKGEKCRVVENSNEYFINTNSFEVIEHSCEYFGSSYLGRHNGSKKLLGVKYKAPIIIEEGNLLIVFPTHSPRNKNCIWISLNNIKKCYKKNGSTNTIIEFVSGDKLELDISYHTINNQILRATRLKMLLEDRKKKIQKDL